MAMMEVGRSGLSETIRSEAPEGVYGEKKSEGVVERREVWWGVFN